jgi:3-methyladenine DNA glycosylase AlkD
MRGTIMNTISERIRQSLFEMQDLKYREFHAKLMPTVEKDTIIGVRVPELRKFAKKMAKENEIDLFLKDLPHQYYEENNVHAFVIEQMKEYDECLTAVKKFLPYINNWATCDMLSPKVFGKHTKELLTNIQKWIASDEIYTIRFGIGMLMRYFLEKEFDIQYVEMVAAVKSEEYYVNMMIAWYFATALAKQYKAVLPLFKSERLDVWTHNKAIQKACESYRITEEQKVYLRTLKRKK